jgi:hypothetical protein
MTSDETNARAFAPPINNKFYRKSFINSSRGYSAITRAAQPQRRQLPSTLRSYDGRLRTNGLSTQVMENPPSEATSPSTP